MGMNKLDIENENTLDEQDDISDLSMLPNFKGGMTRLQTDPVQSSLMDKEILEENIDMESNSASPNPFGHSGKLQKQRSDESLDFVHDFGVVNLSSSKRKSDHFASLRNVDSTPTKEVEVIGDMQYVYEVDGGGKSTLVKRKSLSKITGQGYSLQ